MLSEKYQVKNVTSKKNELNELSKKLKQYQQKVKLKV